MMMIKRKNNIVLTLQNIDHYDQHCCYSPQKWESITYWLSCVWRGKKLALQTKRILKKIKAEQRKEPEKDMKNQT